MTGRKHNSKAVTVQLCFEKALCNVHATTDIKQNEVLSDYFLGVVVQQLGTVHILWLPMLQHHDCCI